MKKEKLNWVRLPLEGVENCRDLGGYGTKNGGQTNWQAFLRSSDMNKLTENDMFFLEEYGVKTVIDLRGTEEIERSPNPLAERDSFHYFNVPFAGQPILEITDLVDMTMGNFYVKLLDKSEHIKTLIDLIDQAVDGGVVFHCSAGKDRTGVLAMLLLGLVGVERKDIISNYEVSYTNLETFHGNIKHEVKAYNVPEEFLYSNREYIELAYDYLIKNYGTVENYLLTKGITQDALDRVKARVSQNVSIAIN